MVMLQRRLFTIDEYHKMAEAGIFCEDDRVELIEGEIVVMMPIGSRHASTVKRANRILGRLLGDLAIISIQDPVLLPPRSEPEPDVAVLRLRPDLYAASHPIPEDVLLLIEVADSSRAMDIAVKMPMYARAGIRESWIIDLTLNQIEVYRRPEHGVYQERTIPIRGGTLTVLAFPDVSIPVSDLLP